MVAVVVAAVAVAVVAVVVQPGTRFEMLRTPAGLFETHWPAPPVGQLLVNANHPLAVLGCSQRSQ